MTLKAKIMDSVIYVIEIVKIMKSIMIATFFNHRY
jgi:hypothetical protein